MQLKQNTSSLFRYLIQQNRLLKTQIQQLNQLLINLIKENPINNQVNLSDKTKQKIDEELKKQNKDIFTKSQFIDLTKSNSQLREQLLNIRAQILICRQIYQQQERQRLILIQQYGSRQKSLHQKIMSLEQQLQLLKRNIKKNINISQIQTSRDTIKIDILSMNIWDQMNGFIKVYSKMQQKYDKQKQKRKLNMIKYLNSSKKQNLSKDQDSQENSNYQQSQESDIENFSTVQQTYTSMQFKKENKIKTPKIPKLAMEKARQVQKLIIEKMQQKDGIKKKNTSKQDPQIYRQQLQQIKQKYIELNISNFAMSRKISYYQRYIEQLQERNVRIIRLKADQVPIQAYELTQRAHTNNNKE